ncbi:MAG: ABC transporter substrate-binding protein [Reyranella sp.]|jgi:peptide/nickel transport system substrate-binding protein|uniref:ABC transporter substrate-binding protein n=1 Tax=Reyranella sp. TaxID=1929291 RepID=UPI00095D69EB|nr:ABC transporter substrate-binding protein [Reyranella sp.]MBN9540782.1 ABC transporter substrate-binding protein [Alphaproteobacteria bacterium]MBR2818412.1 ABC transporter substrate-binding protein [Reyranella sp.]OJU38679.1 MAG: ABC transporter substrate-binding protein [Alphaproteobacteria bacterium 65-37]
MFLRRRRLIAASGLAATGFVLPRVAIGQADQRPSITIAVQQIANSAALEPLREQSNVGQRAFSFLFETLIMPNLLGKLEPVPGLAESWKRLDERTVEFSLRKGVKFHNGDELTADDVVFTFSRDRMFGPDYDIASTKTLFTSVLIRDAVQGKNLPPEVPAVAKRLFPALEKVEAVDKYTVRFTNRTPDVTLEGRIGRLGSDIISRRAYEEAKSWLDWARAPVSTGPYKVREFQPDQVLVMDAHDDYWGGRPPLKSVRMMVVPEVATRINGLLAGQFDFICDVPPDQIPGIEKNPKFEVLGSTIVNHRLTVFDKNHPRLADPRIRQAFTHSIDRQAIVEALWSGRTRVPAGLQWEFYGPMFVENWTVPAYDLAKAKALLKEANYKGDPIPYRLLNNYYTNQVATAQVLVEMWRQAGLNVQIEMKENWQQIFDVNSPRAVRDWSNSAGYNDPISSIVAQHGPQGQQQQVGEWTNEEMNKLSAALETETDMQKRKAMFKRMLEICEREDPAYTVLHQNATFTAKRRDIKWKASPSFAMEFRSSNFASN